MSREDFTFVKMDPPHNDLLWVKTIARILWTKTGEVRDCHEHSIWDDKDGEQEVSTYIWEEGNYRCSCNRHLFFARAGGHPTENTSCGWDDEYLVNLYADKGKLLYQEWNEETKEPLKK